MKQYINPNERHKIVVANNTLCLGDPPEPPSPGKKQAILKKHSVHTRSNIIFTGRMQRRKRVGDLLAASERMSVPELGVILVGPDVERVLPSVLPAGVTHIPTLYGKELLELMVACDICCCPGWVGLNIVDAMACGLPFVTEDLPDHGPEIMYLRDGYNGMIVPPRSIDQLAAKLMQLLKDDELRLRMSKQARKTYLKDASIERMYQGFRESVVRVLVKHV
ncbi:glycosyltransferase family 4 protein [Planctomycetota bacterium]